MIQMYKCYCGKGIKLDNILSLITPAEVVNPTTSGSAYDEKFVKLRTLLFRCRITLKLVFVCYSTDLNTAATENAQCLCREFAVICLICRGVEHLRGNIFVKYPSDQASIL